MATYAEMLTAAKEHCTITNNNTTFDTFLKRQLNDGQSDFNSDLNWKYLEATASISSSTFQMKYTLASDVDVLRSCTYQKRWRLQPIKHSDWLSLNQWESTGTPYYYLSLEGSLAIYPQPDSSAQVNLVSGTVAAADTDITLGSVSGLETRGRVLIDSEVIEYSNIATTTLKQCIRGREGTTAATHAIAATATHRDIEYTYYKTLSDMSADADVSGIPTRYHRALPLFAASKFFYKEEDTAQGDNYMKQYLAVKDMAKRDLGEKQIERFSTTLRNTQAVASSNLDNTFPDRDSLTQDF